MTVIWTHFVIRVKRIIAIWIGHERHMGCVKPKFVNRIGTFWIAILYLEKKRWSWHHDSVTDTVYGNPSKLFGFSLVGHPGNIYVDLCEIRLWCELILWFLPKVSLRYKLGINVSWVVLNPNLWIESGLSEYQFYKIIINWQCDRFSICKSIKTVWFFIGWTSSNVYMSLLKIWLWCELILWFVLNISLIYRTDMNVIWVV